MRACMCVVECMGVCVCVFVCVWACVLSFEVVYVHAYDVVYIFGVWWWVCVCL